MAVKKIEINLDATSWLTCRLERICDWSPSYSVDSFTDIKNTFARMNIFANNPVNRKYANRYTSCLDDQLT